MKKVQITESQLKGIVKRMIREESMSSKRDEEDYEIWTNDERSYLTSRGFKTSPYNKGFAYIINKDGFSGSIRKYDLNSTEAQNRSILYKGKSNFGEYGQFSVNGDYPLEKRSFDNLQDAINYILNHIGKQNQADSQKGNSNMQSLGESQLKGIVKRMIREEI
jgi:hypothetical protein